MNLLTASRVKDARACARLDYFKYQLGYRAVAKDAEAPALGKLVHLGLEAWWRSFDLSTAITAIRAEPADPYAAARAEALLAGYAVRWASAPDEYEVLSVEAEFRAPLRNPETGAPSRAFRLGGRIDVLLRERASGRRLLMEHKTSGEDITPGSVYWRRLRMDSQVSIYFAGAQELGFDVEGCVYDVIGKPKQRPYQAGAKRAQPEAPEEFRDRLLDVLASAPAAFYARNEIARTADDLADAATDQWSIAATLRDAARTGRHPRNPDACMRYGHECDFFAVCSGEAELDGGRYIRLDNPHPELTPEPSEKVGAEPHGSAVSAPTGGAAVSGAPAFSATPTTPKEEAQCPSQQPR